MSREERIVQEKERGKEILIEMKCGREGGMEEFGSDFDWLEILYLLSFNSFHLIKI